MKIVISEFMDESAVDSLRADYPVVYHPGLVDRCEELGHEVADASALVVRNRTRVDVELLDRGPRLRVIGRLGVGLDNIDLDACGKRGIPVCPATGANDGAVAEYVIGAAIVLRRTAFLHSAQVLAGAWPRQGSVGGEIAGSRLGLVGCGGIARRIAGLAAGLGMTVAAFDPFVADADWPAEIARESDLHSLVGSSDVISVHVPLTDETRNLVDGNLLDRCKSGAVLIDTARGGVVDEVALIEALRSGRLGGAALDVFAEEPLGASAASKFQDVPNLILTPHIAGVTLESNRRVSWVTADNVRRVLQGVASD